MYAIVDISGQQYRVSEGDRIKVARQKSEVGSLLTFERVLLTAEGDQVNTGPSLRRNIAVSARVLEHGRNRKVLIYKKKRRKGYQTKNGHRQGYSLLQIEKIAVPGSTAAKSSPSQPEKE